MKISELPEINWRNEQAEQDPDDQLLSQTPPDVVAALGFDPLEFETGVDGLEKSALSTQSS